MGHHNKDLIERTYKLFINIPFSKKDSEIEYLSKIDKTAVSIKH